MWRKERWGLVMAPYKPRPKWVKFQTFLISPSPKSDPSSPRIHPRLMPERLSCPYAGCPSTFRRQNGRTYHVRTVHLNNNVIDEASLPARAATPLENFPELPGNGQQSSEEPMQDTDNEEIPIAQPANDAPRRQASKTFHPWLTGIY